MKQWFQIDATTRRIQGWTRSPKATELPADTAAVAFAEATDAEIVNYESLNRQAIDDNRPDGVLHQNGVVTLPTDTRPRFRIEVDKTTVLADGTDTVTLTVTALKADGTVRTAFNNSVTYELPGGRLLALDFVNGVATKTIKMPQSGRFRLGSTRVAKIETAVDLTAVE